MPSSFREEELLEIREKPTTAVCLTANMWFACNICLCVIVDFSFGNLQQKQKCIYPTHITSLHRSYWLCLLRSGHTTPCCRVLWFACIHGDLFTCCLNTAWMHLRVVLFSLCMRPCAAMHDVRICLMCARSLIRSRDVLVAPFRLW